MQASQDKVSAMKIMAMLTIAFPSLSKNDKSEGRNRVGIENIVFLGGGLLARRGFVWH